MDAKMLFVEAYAREHISFSFRGLLEKQASKMEVIVTFLVILELMKTGKIRISQEHIFDDILITSNLNQAEYTEEQNVPQELEE